MSKKFDDLVEAKFPAYEFISDSEEFHDVMDGTSSGFSDDVIDLLFGEVWPNIRKLEGLPEERQDEIRADLCNAAEREVELALFAEWLSCVVSYGRELASLGPVDLQERYRLHEKESGSGHKSYWREPLLSFNNIGADADFDYWLRVKTWTAEEAALLLLRKDPRKIDFAAIEKEAGPHFNHLKFVTAYRDNLRLIGRELGMGDGVTIERSKLIDWAKRHRILPSELEIESKSLEARKLPPKSRSIREIESRSLETLYKIVLGLAVESHQHKWPSSPNTRSTATASICKKLDGTRCAVGKDAVLRALRDAEQFLQERSLD